MIKKTYVCVRTAKEYDNRELLIDHSEYHKYHKEKKF